MVESNLLYTDHDASSHQGRQPSADNQKKCNKKWTKRTPDRMRKISTLTTTQMSPRYNLQNVTIEIFNKKQPIERIFDVKVLGMRKL